MDTLMSTRPARSSEVPVPGEAVNPESLIGDFTRLAREDSSALVRLALASALQRLPVTLRPSLAGELVKRAEDAEDHNLPLMIWYGLIPVDPAALAELAMTCELPATRRCIARRLAEDVERNPGPLDTLLAWSAEKGDTLFQKDILDGAARALTGWRKARKPASWDAVATRLGGTPDKELQGRLRELSALFGDGRALDEVKKLAFDKEADLEVRKAALRTLIDNRPPDLREICEQLIGQRFLNTVAATGLALYDDPQIGIQLVKAYRKFHHSERGQLLETLVSRPSFASALLDAVAAGDIPRDDITAFHARQIHNYNDPALNRKLTEVWGELRASDADKQALMVRLQEQLTPDALEKADKSNGRMLFNMACSSCHRLYGQGGGFGPDLTGSGRDNLHYLLENIVDPSAVVSADFRLSVLNLKDGRVLSGVKGGVTERTMTLRTMTDELTLERDEIEKIEELSISMMPEGLISAFGEEQVRDLFAYLMHKSQVPLPEETK